MGKHRTRLYQITMNAINFFSKLRVSAGWFFFIVVAITGRIHFFWPIILIVIGELFRTIASGTIVKNEKLATSGIYSIVRHPLYLGSMLIGTGFVLMCMNIFVGLYFIVFFPLCYLSAIVLEEQSLEKRFGSDFHQYRKNVPAFFPIKITGKFRSDTFSWKLVFQNKEHYNWLTLLATILILIIKSRF